MTKEVRVSYIKHLLPPLDPLIAHDCKQGNAKNLKKDESDPPLYEDHQSSAVSSHFISSSKAALFHFMDIMKANMDSAAVVECNEVKYFVTLLKYTFHISLLYLSRINSAYFLLLLRCILQQLLYFLLHYISTTYFFITFSDQFSPAHPFVARLSHQ